MQKHASALVLLWRRSSDVATYKGNRRIWRGLRQSAINKQT